MYFQILPKAVVPVLLAIVCVAAVPAFSFGQSIQWQTDIDLALKQAEKERRLVLLHFTASWCQPCKNLDTFVFRSPRVTRVFDATVIPVNVDADQNQELVEKYDVKSVPFDVFLTATGRVVLRRPSPRDTEGYISMLNGLGKILDKVGVGDDPAVTRQLNELEELMAIEQAAFQSEREKIKQTGPEHMMPRPSSDSSNLKRFHDSRVAKTDQFNLDKPSGSQEFVDNPFFGSQAVAAPNGPEATPERDRITPPSGIVNNSAFTSKLNQSKSSPRTQENRFFQPGVTKAASPTSSSVKANRQASTFESTVQSRSSADSTGDNSFDGGTRHSVNLDSNGSATTSFSLPLAPKNNSPTVAPSTQSPAVQKKPANDKDFLPPEPPDFLKKASSGSRVIIEPDRLSAKPESTHDSPKQPEPKEATPDRNGFIVPEDREIGPRGDVGASFNTDGLDGVASVSKSESTFEIPGDLLAEDSSSPRTNQLADQPAREAVNQFVINQPVTGEVPSSKSSTAKKESDQAVDVAAGLEQPEFDFNQNPLGLTSDNSQTKSVEVQAMVWSAQTVAHPPRKEPVFTESASDGSSIEGSQRFAQSSEGIQSSTSTQAVEFQGVAVKPASENLAAQTVNVTKATGELVAPRKVLPSVTGQLEPVRTKLGTAIGKLQPPAIIGTIETESTEEKSSPPKSEISARPAPSQWTQTDSTQSDSAQSDSAETTMARQRSFSVDINQSKALLALARDQRTELNQNASESSSSIQRPVAVGVVKLDSNQYEELRSGAGRQATFSQAVGQVSAQIESQVASRGDGPGEKAKYALHGKCPVALMTQGKWVAGDEKIGCVHRERIYLFSDLSSREKFLADPDAYSPLLAGFDPVIYLETGKLIEGDESFGVFMGKTPNQRIVLFVSPDTRQRFQSAPAKYIDNVRKAMSKQ